jgi:hypothetical protein
MILIEFLVNDWHTLNIVGVPTDGSAKIRYVFRSLGALHGRYRSGKGHSVITERVLQRSEIGIAFCHGDGESYPVGRQSFIWLAAI